MRGAWGQGTTQFSAALRLFEGGQAPSCRSGEAPKVEIYSALKTNFSRQIALLVASPVYTPSLPLAGESASSQACTSSEHRFNQLQVVKFHFCSSHFPLPRHSFTS